MAEKEKRRKWLFVALAVAGLAVLAALVAFLLNTESSMAVRQRTATYEATAAEHMRNIAAAQRIYLDAYGQYATFDQLIEAGVLTNEKFRGESPAVDGYVYRLRVTPREGESAPSFAVNADPQPGGPGAGAPYFYLDSNVVGLRQNDSRPAGATDRPRP